MGVKAADLSRWVLRSTEAELGDLLKVMEVHNSMAPLAIESDKVHFASSAGSVGAVVVPLTISQRPTNQR